MRVSETYVEEVRGGDEMRIVQCRLCVVVLALPSKARTGTLQLSGRRLKYTKRKAMTAGATVGQMVPKGRVQTA